MTGGIELRAVSIGYRHRRRTVTVATGLTALARRGELTVLLGPNGAGKSTLIRTLAGLQPALDGTVRLGGTDLTRLTAVDRARRVAVVLTDRVEAGLLSARELVGLGRIPHLGLSGRLGGDDAAVVDWALDAVGAQQLAGRPAAELSDGERQRVLTARALAQQPELLVLDEPTAFLDVAARADLLGLLRRLAREQQLAVLLSTHDLELALRLADRVWLLDPAGGLTDAVGEELMLSGRIGALFDGDTVRFDATGGVFTCRSDDDGRGARIDAPEPLRTALGRVLSREGFSADGPAEILVAATEPDAITVRTGTVAETTAALGGLPTLLRGLPPQLPTCAPAAQVTAVLTEIASVSSYFEVTSGPVEGAGWRPVRDLYTEPDLIADAVEGVRRRIQAPDLRVAVSTFFLGFAARLWSIGIGALAGHRLLVDLHPDQLRYREHDGRIHLHLVAPTAWQVPDAAQAVPALADAVLDAHLSPLAEAVRRLGPISAKLLRGNAGSAALGAARAFDRHHGRPQGPGWELGRALCEDERLTGTVLFTESGICYRRTTCCLFYRTPGAGLCIDCALDRKPGSGPDKARKESS
ncbi:(2Fe-2S)-binding protein [Mycobacterium sp. M1]|uniref:(2Fe-2S)-binding protein n=1 Tax=Mycolicibacter acidiphilus TaxID=2835306 RepID=A0ABS5RI99_9MYCO|nr:ATP-binding cassette domain-containing protein [Mycolicibacter acidiphilus]MBS9533924.1 (2Fe-2S)-binding protein [Mycolicibacter acidiphilus]